MKKTILIVIAFISSLCANAQVFTTTKGGNCFTIDIPNYLTKAFDLNDVASLQYHNTTKEAYVVVIEDSKDQLEYMGAKFVGTKDFLESFVKDYKIDSANRKLGSIAQFEANGNKHAQVELTWRENGTNFYMLITSVETNLHFYNIMCWTVIENKDQLKKDYLAISKSLKE